MEDALLPGGGAAPPPQHPRRATVRSTVLNVFTLICYPYGVPYCFGQMGWVLGSVFLVGSTWINVEAGVALGEICARHDVSIDSLLQKPHSDYFVVVTEAGPRSRVEKVAADVEAEAWCVGDVFFMPVATQE